MKLLPIFFGNWLFKDFVHLNYKGNETLVESIIYALKMLPDSAFLPTSPVAAFDISDISQFPPLSAKRSAADTSESGIAKCPRVSYQYEEDLCRLKEELAEAKKAIKDLNCAQKNKDSAKSEIEELKNKVMALQSRKENDLDIVESYRNQLVRIDQGCLEVLESFKQRLVKVEETVHSDKEVVDVEETGEIENNTIQSSNSTCSVL